MSSCCKKLDNEKDVVATQEARCIIESKVPKRFCVRLVGLYRGKSSTKQCTI